MQSISDVYLYKTSCDQIITSPEKWLGDSGNNIPMIGWTALIFCNHMINSGQVKDGFVMKCSKYSKIVNYFVQGYRILPDNPSNQSEITADEYLNDILNNSYHGFTIGPADTMDSFSPLGYLDTLLNFNQRSFGLGWIANSLTENKYANYFNTAKTQFQQNNIAAIQNTLQTVLQEVNQDSSSNLTSEAYALLRYNIAR